ncbi:beta-lactamase family protein [Cercophora newfieldiana]|uniref:Beta-lactamase family protein n=1 Tax=Cercophora newfieldiana TaxID=92897 RepID=A0AA40CJJ8_9PEZI|nr:beta-lactamase family protein [Cercophora newfieldiana]
MSWTIESTVEKAIEDGVLPGAVLFAKDKSGKLNYSKALGQSSLDPSSPAPMELDTVFALASMTKLLTAIAALQLVDRGLITLDADLSPHLPELAAKLILTGFTPTGDPVTVPRTRPITLRHLLTHSSGCGYSFLSPTLAKYIGTPPPVAPSNSVPDRFDFPLLFEPGTSWEYGCSIDWAGHLVTVLTSTPLDAYITKHILAPLSIPAHSITFYPESHPSACLPRLALMTARDPSTNRVSHSPLPPPASSPDRCPLGGEGAYSSLQSYIVVLDSLLRDDGVLLSPTVSKTLFTPQLEPGAKKALLENVKNPFWIVGWVPDTGEYDWSTGGLLVDGGSHAWRKEGFLFWAGVFNLNWFIDRTAGVCGIFGTQISNPADPLVRPLMKAFEEEVYAKLQGNGN